MAKRTTIQMVADAAGVSRGTVDRVLNGRSYVSADVRERVLDAIRETRYISPRQRHQQQLAAALPPLKLGVLLPNWSDQFRTDVESGIALARAELALSSVEIILRRCETDIPQEAISLLNEMAAAGVGGLAVCALSDPSIERRISELAQGGIPCITFNSDLPGSRRLCFVGQHIRKSGRVAAQLMHKCVPSDGVVLATVGNLKFDGHLQRLNGFQERMLELGFDRRQILVAETFNDYETTLRVVSQALEAHPALSGIYMANLSVSGCAEAVRLAGKHERVRVICHDINEGIRRLLLDGSIDFTIPQDLKNQGYAPLRLLRDVVQLGKAPDAAAFDDRIQIICAENL